MSEARGELATKWLSQALGLKEDASPFPWQIALLDDLTDGRLWTALDLPTGLGKTSVLAIWLVARALGAPLPRRIAYIVDRRAVVDQATDVAMSLRAFVEQTPEVAARLGISNRLLSVSTLRGQFVDNREWLDDPAAPAIVLGTVDMIGSRLLFEGYGVSRKMRPYHAGLLGSDTLAVLDEAHLVLPFERMLEDIASKTELGPQDEALRKLVPPFRMLSLSATGRRGHKGKAFRLTPDDFGHPEIIRRLSAPKRIAIRDLPADAKLAVALADEAWRLAENGHRPIRCIVFSDRREDAVKAKEEVERLARGNKKTGTQPVKIAADLFVGGRRVLERQLAAQRLETLGFIAGKGAQPQRPTFLFATSAAEVGVDLDADDMVCDLVTWERMVQRLGRVNRRGEVQGGSDVTVIVGRGDKKTQEALKKKPEDRSDQERKIAAKHDAGVASLRAVKELLPWANGTADASTGSIRELNERAATDCAARHILDAATTAEPMRPALTRALVGAWSLTSLESHPGRPEVDPWLRGWIEDDPPQTQIVWRTHLPVREGLLGTKREVEAFFEAAPPHTSEILETETFRVVEWLALRAERLPNVANADRVQSDCQLAKDVAAIVISKNGKLRAALRLAELSPDKDARKKLLSVLAGATLIVDARIAGLTSGLLDESGTVPPPTADDGQQWMPGESGVLTQQPPVVKFRVRSVRAGESGPASSQWRERMRFAAKISDDGEARLWLIVEKWCSDSANEEDRSTSLRQGLEDHRNWAEDRARALARSFDLPERYEEVLCAAAFLHDEGKRSSRWQRAFNAPDTATVWAKTEGPINFLLLDDYRHEFGSVIAVDDHERLRCLPDDLRDLALHLIAAHHGFARPSIRTQGCDAAPPSVLEPYAKAIALRFERLQQRWGPWGLAWWESLLRASDQQASRDNETRAVQIAVVANSGGA